MGQIERNLNKTNELIFRANWATFVGDPIDALNTRIEWIHSIVPINYSMLYAKSKFRLIFKAGSQVEVW